MCVFGQLFQTYLFTVCGFVNANSRVSRPGVFGERFFFFVEKWHFILGRNCTVAAFKKRNPADSNVRKSHE